MPNPDVKMSGGFPDIASLTFIPASNSFIALCSGTLLTKDNLKRKLKANLSRLANAHVSPHQSSQNDIKTLHIPKKLRRNKNIVILRPDKGNGVANLDRTERGGTAVHGLQIWLCVRYRPYRAVGVVAFCCLILRLESFVETGVRDLENDLVF